jgi:hypothetical protein
MFKSTQEIKEKKRRLASPSPVVDCDGQALRAGGQGLDTKEGESKGNKKSTVVKPQLGLGTLFSQKTYNFFRVFSLFLLFL